jgi:citronellyl-CoA dehydrogenase
MPGLVPGIHVFFLFSKKDVDGRHKPGHDGMEGSKVGKMA